MYELQTGSIISSTYISSDSPKSVFPSKADSLFKTSKVYKILDSLSLIRAHCAEHPEVMGGLIGGFQLVGFLHQMG